jgi:hypothetical protein
MLYARQLSAMNAGPDFALVLGLGPPRNSRSADPAMLPTCGTPFSRGRRASTLGGPFNSETTTSSEMPV